MQHILFKDNKYNKYEIGILIKTSSFKKEELKTHYVDYLISQGVNEDSIIGFNLKYNDKGTCPVSFQREYLKTLLKAVDNLGVTTLLVADSGYFKTLANVRKVEPQHGYILPCAIKGFEHINVILSLNYQGLFYKPELQSKIDLSLTTVVNHYLGTHVDIGSTIIHSESYPETLSEISDAFTHLHQFDALTLDLEAFSLEFQHAGVGTVAFAWDQHNGLAFCCDYKEAVWVSQIDGEPSVAPLLVGKKETNSKIRTLFREFLETYKGKLIYHNSNYDLKLLIYNLWMDDLLDTAGLLRGLEVVTRLFEDTKLIAYLATNSTAGNDLKLKNLAHEFTGNYAQDDINDIRMIPKASLLKYNLIDCLATWYVYNKYKPILIADQQQPIYEDLFLPSVKVLLQMELTGMPLDMGMVKSVRYELENKQTIFFDAIYKSKIILAVTAKLQKEECMKRNLLLKKKVKPLSDFDYIHFNPGSNKNLAYLLYSHLGFEIQDTTATGQPAVGSKVIKKLMYQLINEYNISAEDLK